MSRRVRDVVSLVRAVVGCGSVSAAVVWGVAWGYSSVPWALGLAVASGVAAWWLLREET